MPTANPYVGIKQTVEVCSDTGQGCKECGQTVGGAYSNGEITPGINHYIQEHGYTLLHVGTQSTQDDEGKTFQTTVAVLGKK